jgi:glycerol-1-phosphate dehydrogenase [NAD(P)+]
MEVQLCNLVGHARPEEGSEHYFAYCAEQFTVAAWPHADLLGPGILLMAQLQGQEPKIMKAAMMDCNVPLDRIPQDVVTLTLAELQAYCRKHDLPYGIAHTLDNLQDGP